MAAVFGGDSDWRLQLKTPNHDSNSGLWLVRNAKKQIKKDPWRRFLVATPTEDSNWRLQIRTPTQDSEWWEMPKKLRRTRGGGLVRRLWLMTLTEDSDSGLQLRTPISEKCQKNLRRTRVAAVWRWGLWLRTPTQDSNLGLRLVRNAKKIKKDPCGGGVALRTLTLTLTLTSTRVWQFVQNVSACFNKSF